VSDATQGTSVGPVMVFSARRAEVERFYREVVGLPYQESGVQRDAAWLSAANADLAVHSREDPETPPDVAARRGFVVWFGVGDIAAAYRRASAANAVVGSLYPDYFFARDPDGRYVGFHTNEEDAHGHDHDR